MLRDCALKEESRAVYHIVHGRAVGNKVKIERPNSGPARIVGILIRDS